MRRTGPASRFEAICPNPEERQIPHILQFTLPILGAIVVLVIAAWGLEVIKRAAHRQNSDLGDRP